MYVVMGYTRGDELIRSTSKPLFASASLEECTLRMQLIREERDEWLAVNEVSYMQRCVLYARFDIVKTPFD